MTISGIQSNATAGPSLSAWEKMQQAKLSLLEDEESAAARRRARRFKRTIREASVELNSFPLPPARLSLSSSSTSSTSHGAPIVSILRKPSSPTTPASPAGAVSPSPSFFPPHVPLPPIPSRTELSRRRSSRVRFTDDTTDALPNGDSSAPSRQDTGDRLRTSSIPTPELTSASSFSHLSSAPVSPRGISASPSPIHSDTTKSRKKSRMLNSPRECAVFEDDFDINRPQTLRYPKLSPNLARLSDSSNSSIDAWAQRRASPVSPQRGAFFSLPCDPPSSPASSIFMLSPSLVESFQGQAARVPLSGDSIASSTSSHSSSQRSAVPSWMESSRASGTSRSSVASWAASSPRTFSQSSSQLSGDMAAPRSASLVSTSSVASVSKREQSFARPPRSIPSSVSIQSGSFTSSASYPTSIDLIPDETLSYPSAYDEERYIPIFNRQSDWVDPDAGLSPRSTPRPMQDGDDGIFPTALPVPEDRDISHKFDIGSDRSGRSSDESAMQSLDVAVDQLGMAFSPPADHEIAMPQASENLAVHKSAVSHTRTDSSLSAVFSFPVPPERLQELEVTLNDSPAILALNSAPMIESLVPTEPASRQDSPSRSQTLSPLYSSNQVHSEGNLSGPSGTATPGSPTMSDLLRDTPRQTRSRSEVGHLDEESDLDLGKPALNAALRCRVISTSSRLLVASKPDHRKSPASLSQHSDDLVSSGGTGWSGSESEEEEFARTVARIALRKSFPKDSAAAQARTNRLSRMSHMSEASVSTASTLSGPTTPEVGRLTPIQHYPWSPSDSIESPCSSTRPHLSSGRPSRPTRPDSLRSPEVSQERKRAHVQPTGTAALLSALIEQRYRANETLPRPKRFVEGWGAPEVLLDDEWPTDPAEVNSLETFVPEDADVLGSRRPGSRSGALGSPSSLSSSSATSISTGASSEVRVSRLPVPSARMYRNLNMF